MDELLPELSLVVECVVYEGVIIILVESNSRPKREQRGSGFMRIING